MIYVRVLGSGLIPRNMGIAPKKKPFKADLETIKIMLAHGSLKVEMQNPFNVNEFIPIDSSNLLKLYKAYDGIEPGIVDKPVKQVRASNPVDRDVIVPADQPVEKPRVDVKQDYNKKNHNNDQHKNDDKKNMLKPVGNPNEK